MKTWRAFLGTDFQEPLTLKDSAGTIFNLTGHTVTVELRKQLEGQLLIGPLTITPSDAAAGECEVDFTDAQINDAGLGRHVLDIKVVRDSDSYIFRSETVELHIRGKVTA